MKNASLYHQSNEVQRRDAKDVLERFAQQIQWRSDGTDTLLDVGCGTGDVTIDLILPIVPKNITKLVGVDISEDMVEYARQNYQNSIISFEILNIGSSIESFLNDHPDAFGVITSFYCLHWEWNQEQAIKNIYNLLKPGGYCLLMFLAHHPFCDAYKELSQITKWSPFMKNVKQCTIPYQNSKNPSGDFIDLLKLAGFSKLSVEIPEKFYTHDGISTLKRDVNAINPFIGNMTDSEREEFFDDFIKTLIQMEMAHKKNEENDYKFVIPYTLLIAFAKK